LHLLVFRVKYQKHSIKSYVSFKEPKAFLLTSIILQLSKSEALNQKQLQTYPALKVTLSEIIGSLILGLIRLI
jgi:hypothetical protein